jgi:hypothetical protein
LCQKYTTITATVASNAYPRVVMILARITLSFKYNSYGLAPPGLHVSDHHRVSGDGNGLIEADIPTFDPTICSPLSFLFPSERHA